MRCHACGRETPSAADELCPTCALTAEREVDEIVGDEPVEHCEFDGKAMDISGLPARTPVDETTTSHADPAVPGAILGAPDVDRDFFLRNAGGGSA